jgi:hypothetical protein
VCFVYLKDAHSGRAIAIVNERKLIPLKNGKERVEQLLKKAVVEMKFEAYIKF